MSALQDASASEVIPIRENLTLCPICGQIYDNDHMGETFHHRHEDGGEQPLPPDTRAAH